MDNFNVMPIVFGLLALIFGTGVAYNLVQIVRHPSPETSPPLPARALPAERQPATARLRPRPTPGQAVLGMVLYALGLLLLKGLLSRHRSS